MSVSDKSKMEENFQMPLEKRKSVQQKYEAEWEKECGGVSSSQKQFNPSHDFIQYLSVGNIG